MAGDGSDEWSISERPFAYVIFPLLIIVIGGFFATMLYRRRRRQHAASSLSGSRWPREPRFVTVTRIPHTRFGGGGGGRRNNRSHPWGNMRSQEGLNELGEAPPPYDGKRERGAGAAQSEELRDLEAGTARPPAYPDQPAAAVTRDARGS